MRTSRPNPDARTALFSLEQIGIKLGLDQIRGLVAALERPDRAFPSIIVAGTNGKGSVTAMIERGLRAAGYRTGRYTSPHLVHIEERFAIDGVPISTSTFDTAAARVLDAGTWLPAPPSFFEATTALALDVFRDARVDIAVLEVGLGGRLDATNIVDAHAVAITAVDFDHQQYLGHTLREIAGEKAGVIKPGSLVVLQDNATVVDEVVAERCAAVDARLVRATDGVRVMSTMADGRARITVTTPVRRYDDVTLGLRGRHQIANAMTALRLLEELPGVVTGIELGETSIRAALEEAVWPARLELTRVAGVDVLIDGAHNVAGAAALAAYVADTYGRRLPMVVGIMRDKDLGALIGALAASASTFAFTAPTTARAAAPDDLVRIAATVAPDVPARAFSDPYDAIRHAATAGRPVVVAGSLYLAGELRPSSNDGSEQKPLAGEER